MKTSAIVIKLTHPILLLALLAARAGIFWQRPGSPTEITTLRGETFELFGRGLYRNDTVSYAAQAIGQDAATLLFVGLLLARKGSLRGELLLAGGLGYVLSTYTSYSFLSAYNEFFLVHVALFLLSLFAFILALSEMDTERASRSVSGRMPRRRDCHLPVAAGPLS